MRPDSVFAPVTNRPHLQVHALEGTKRPLDLGQQLVAAHGVVGVHPLLSKTGADHVDAVNGSFRSDLCVVDFEAKAVVANVQLEVLADFVLVENSAYPHTDFTFTIQLTPPDPLANPFQLLSDGLHVSLPPLEPFVGELRVAVGDARGVGGHGCLVEREVETVVTDVEPVVAADLVVV